MKGNKIEYYFSVKAIKIPQKVKVDAGDLNSSIVTDYSKTLWIKRLKYH